MPETPGTHYRDTAFAWLPDALTRADLGIAALLLAFAIFALALVAHLLLRALLPWLSWGDRLLRRGQAYALARWPEQRLPWLRTRLAAHPAELALLAGAGLVLWATAAALFELIDDVVEQDAVVTVDLALFQALQALRTPPVDLLMVAITDLGGAWITGPLMAAVAVWLAWRRHWAAFGYWVGAAVATRISVVLLKWLLARERPTQVYSGVETLSFPSGHATTAMVLYGFLAFLLGRRLPPAARFMLYAGAAVLIAAIGLSRLYLGVHWLSDVGAGFALGFAWVTLLAVAFARLHPQQRPRTAELAVVVGVTLVVAAAVQFSWRFDASLERYRPPTSQQFAVTMPGCSIEARANDLCARSVLVRSSAIASSASRSAASVATIAKRHHLCLDPLARLVGEFAAAAPVRIDRRAEHNPHGARVFDEAAAGPAVAGIVRDRYQRHFSTTG